MNILCKVYRSPKRAETYLYVDALEAMARVPAELLDRFGEPVEALSIVLHPGRRLARANVEQVIKAIREQGYYLQMPPPPGQEVETLLDNGTGQPDAR